MNKFITGTMAAAIALGGSFAADHADAATRELRFAEYGPNAGARSIGVKWLDEELRKRSDGELGLDIIWGGALVGASGAAKAISDGVADMGSITATYAPGELVTYEAVDTLVFPDEYVGVMAAYDLMTTHPAALKEADDFNIRYFGNYTTGPTQLLTRDKPVSSIDDLQGMTIRAVGVMVPALEASGAATVAVPQPKTYEALSNGSVDGTATYYYVVNGYKQYEVADYMTELNMGQITGFGIVMNKQTFESLSPEHQDMMTELGRDFTVKMAEIMSTLRVKTKAQLVEGIDGHSIEIVEPDDGMRATLIQAAEKDAQNWLAKAENKGLDGEEIFAAYRDLVESYQAGVDADGYPWE
ncbi:C4-dicarboxylate TRAP transporter substrate-binding protein [Roseovarius nanhaiticus]|uniref:C4-dicarboxylate TRAP transporter substrate-binding protein n=1 Tax=Roseovarius nanhaiticus TaxID=573024 RepID=UPI00248FB349|nr:C4-dicarboxylate TRAP transporter substrate-binding protein [Roseovarius nanhaiticus]